MLHVIHCPCDIREIRVRVAMFRSDRSRTGAPAAGPVPLRRCRGRQVRGAVTWSVAHSECLFKYVRVLLLTHPEKLSVT